MTQYEYMVNKKEEIYQLQKELEWYRIYGEFIAVNYAHANAEGIEYADKEIE
jgi:hypothetical protein